MAILSWGKCSITHTTSTGGEPASGGTWTAIDTPKEDSTVLNPTAGAEKVATAEGGEVVDVLFGKNTYQLEFDIFVKKGGTRPFSDNDGVVSGEHAFRVTPEDATCEGIQIDRSVVRVEESYKAADGIILRHVVKCLKPKTGNTIKPYTASSGT